MEPRSEVLPVVVGPRFYLTARQPVRPGAVLLAVVLAAGVMGAVLYGLRQTGHVLRDAGRSAGSAAAAKDAEEKDDPSQVDTIVLGDPADAPVPARKGEHVSSVHPTILVRLPRFGEEAGLIPDTAAGRLLYGWLAAFNQASYPALANALPTAAMGRTAASEMELRRQTGGFSLLSAKEVEPGVLVFRLRSQLPPVTEALGTLQVREGSSPAEVASFSLRGVEAAGR